MSARSGPTQTEAQYRARGLHRVVVRIPMEYVKRWDALCEDSGYSRAEMLMGMIDGETAEIERVRAGKR